MSRFGRAALALWLGAGTLSPVRGASCGEDACRVDDGLALLQSAAGRQEAASRLAAGAVGTLCALAPAGGLAPEVAAFLKENANNTQLEQLLSQEWIQACAGPAAVTDAGLVSRLRVVVHAFAGGTPARSGKAVVEKPVRGPDLQAFQKSSLGEEPDCSELKSQLRSWGLSTPPARVMDYGCGPGSSLAAYGKCGVGQNNVGVDVQDARAGPNKEFFQFVQLEKPYPFSLFSKISSEHLDGAFGLVFSEQVYHHIGSEKDIRLTSKELGRTLAPCGVIVLQDWDNPGSPDLTPLYDLTHTFWTLLCLPYTKEKAKKCVGDVSDQQLHEMWEGEHTIYLSLERYRNIVETEAGVELVHQTRFTGGGWNDILNPFQLVFRKPC